MWVWDDGSPPGPAAAPVEGLKFRALAPLDATGRWRTAEILAGQAPHEVARAKKMTLEAFHAANPHLEEGSTITDGMVVWYWETAEQRAFAEQQRENVARHEEAREAQKTAALAASAATPPVEDREALPKAWDKIKAAPKAWKTDPAFQAEIDARERAIWGLGQTPQPVSPAGSAPAVQNAGASNERKPLDRPGRWIQISVKPGDTIPKIASKYGMSWTEIDAGNPGVGAKIRVGQMVWVWEGGGAKQ